MSQDAAREASNVAILKEAYRQWEATRGGSVDHWMSIIDPHIAFGSIPRGQEPMPFAKAYDNREELREYFSGLLAEWAMVHYSFDEFIAQGEAVVARGVTAWTNKRTGKTVETPKVDYWRLRNGKIIEFYEYFDTAQVAAAAM